MVIDYQNVHLTGAGLFLPGRPIEEGLIEPYRFACQLVLARNAKSEPEHQVEVSRVEVFRGLPIQRTTPRPTAATRSSVRVGCAGITGWSM